MKKRLLLVAIMANLVTLPAVWPTAAYGADAAAVQAKEGWFKALVDFDFMRQHVDIPPKKGVMIIDSRPAARQYDPGHIPGAVNIPDSQFDKQTARLPDDKATLLLFYCGGINCMLSHNSAFKAERLGYTNVKVYPAGMPDWQANGGPISVSAAHLEKLAAGAAATSAALVSGKEKGSVTVASFEQVWKTNAASVMLVDVRDAKEFAAGTIKGAVNIPMNDLEKAIATLPTDMPVVFVCGTGARSGEAYDTVKLLGSKVSASFLDADVKFNADGTYSMTQKK